MKPREVGVRTTLLIVATLFVAGVAVGVLMSVLVSDTDENTTKAPWNAESHSSHPSSTAPPSTTTAPPTTTTTAAPTTIPSTTTLPSTTASPTTTLPAIGLRALEYFVETEATCIDYSRSVGNDPPDTARYRSVDLIQILDPDRVLIADGLDYELIVDFGGRPATIYSSQGPEAMLPHDLSFGCPADLYLGTADA